MKSLPFPVAASVRCISRERIPADMSLVDPRASRLQQGIVGVLALAAFVLDAPLVLPALAALLAVALLAPAHSPTALLWRRVLVPALRLAPAKPKDAAPARFAQAVGLLFLAGASAVLLAAPALALVGWALALLVAALALLAASTGLCVGCRAYVLLVRLRARPARG